MKKLFAFMLAAIFALTLTVYADVTSDEIALTADNFGDCVASTTPDDLTWEDGTVNGDDVPLFGLKLPQPVALGDTVVISIKGTADGDFRVWLLASGEKTFSNQYKMSEGGFESGSFDRTIELTAEDFDGAGLSEATNICFKGPVYGENLHNLTLESVKIYYCTMEEYVANEVDFSEADAKAAEAIAKADALYDVIGDTEALEAGIAEIENDYIPYLESFSALDYEGAINAVNELYDKVRDIRDESILASVSEYIEKAEAAINKAKSSDDITVLTECLNEAKEAAGKVSSSAGTYPKSRAKAGELMDAVEEIEAKIEKLSSPAEPADGTTANGGDSEEKGGCGSALGAAAAIIALTSVFGCAMIKKH